MPKNVRLCTFDEKRLHELWLKIRDFDPLFSDDIRGDETWFVRRMGARTTVTLETDGGLLLLSDISENNHAAAHIVFWDHKLSPRIDMIKECLFWAFLSFNLQRIEVVIPEFSRALRRVLDKLGFVFEGRMRKRMRYKGHFCDTLMYSILKEEVV